MHISFIIKTYEGIILSKTNFYKRFIFYFILFGLILSVFSGSTNYFYHQSLQKTALQEKAVEIYDIKINNTLKPTLTNLENTVFNLSTNKILIDYIKQKQSIYKEQLQLMFLATANANRNIMQVWFLDNTGNEIVRIDRNKNDNKAFIISDAKLQNKKSRYYFHDIAKTPNNEIWYSPLDLNVEQGKIEIPWDIQEDFELGLDDDSLFLFDLSSQINNSDKLTLVLKPKQEYLEEQHLAELKVGIFTMIVNFLLSLIMSAILAKKPMNIQNDLLKANKHLSIYNKEIAKKNIFIESILRHSAHAIITTDLDGIITSFNKQAQKLLGYDKKDVIGKINLIDFHKDTELVNKAKEYSKVLKQDIEPNFEVLKAKTNSGWDNDDEWTYLSKYGIEFIVSLHITALKDVNENIIGYIALAEDITHKKFLENKLEEQKNELETIFDTTKDGIAILDINLNFLWNVNTL